jgi:hypothetical protein
MKTPLALLIQLAKPRGRTAEGHGFTHFLIDPLSLPPACKAALIGGVLGLAFAPAPVLPQPAGAGPPANVVALSDFPWHTFEWIERRYKIEAMRFKARDETGWDWPGSDEVMVETSDAKGFTVSNEIENIDSGDTHHFAPAKSCIIAVRPGVVVLGKTSVCDDVGEPAPLGFGVEIWEKDDFGYPPGFCDALPPGPGRHAGPHCANDHNGDDFIGVARIDYSAQDLEAGLPNVGDEVIESITLDPCPGYQCAGYADYTFTWRITRLRDVRIDLRAVLDEAMQKSGTRSELEAIVTGLRALRALSPRKTEPETAR